MWGRWQKGEALHKISALFNRNHNSIVGILSRTVGILPPQRKRSQLALAMSERENISRGAAAGNSIQSIAITLGCSASTMGRAINHNSGRRCYRANEGINIQK